MMFSLLKKIEEFMLTKFVFICIIFITFSISAKDNVIRILGPQSSEDVTQDYYAQLLIMALKKGSDKSFELELMNAKKITQDRTLHLLANKYLDVYWTGASFAREKKFYAIKIPLVKGLLGYRVSIIRDKDLADFKTLSQDEFKHKIGCQGARWPDTDILKFNGFTVDAVVQYELMFGMVSKSRCDYFPRAIFEGYGELIEAQKKFNNLIMFDDVLLYYPQPIYFFVNKDNEELGLIIKRGLEILIDNGEFERLMKNHPSTSKAFPLERWKKKKVFHLENPLLSEDTNIHNSRYWVTPPKK